MTTHGSQETVTVDIRNDTGQAAPFRLVPEGIADIDRLFVVSKTIRAHLCSLFHALTPVVMCTAAHTGATGSLPVRLPSHIAGGRAFGEHSRTLTLRGA